MLQNDPQPIVEMSKQKLLSGSALIPAVFSRLISHFGYGTLATILCATYLLLPIERGFPSIPVAGYHISLTVIVSIVIFVLLAAASRGRIVVVTPYVAAQYVVLIALTIAAIISQSLEGGSLVILSYSSTFILNFIIVYHLFKEGYRRQFTIILCAIMTLAAILCILEGLFRFYLPFYFEMLSNYDYQAMQYAAIRIDFRAMGVLGNSIVSSVALVLAIPFVYDLRHWVKYPIIVMLLCATYLTLSRTALLILLPLLVGLFVLSKRKPFEIIYVMMLLILIFLLLPSNVRDSVLSAVDQYLNRDQGVNVVFRQQMVEWGIREFLSQQNLLNSIFGEGLKSTSILPTTVASRNVTTIDNAYLTLLLETGIFGLFSLLASYIMALRVDRRALSRNFHWYGVLGLMIAGLSFVTVYYATFNLIWVASIAVLAIERQMDQPSSANSGSAVLFPDRRD